MPERWYQQAVVYCLDVETFQDSNGDGVGDLRGMTSRLDYLARLGVTTLWLNPIHPTPGRDDGYDVSDYYGVDPRLGSLGDFVELVHQCENRGIRLIIDLVVNHTSDQHPWFQSARTSADSQYRDWYVWSQTEPPNAGDGVVFPGYQRGIWSYDKVAKLWYHHRFYDFQPDLNWNNPEVREEIGRVVSFWLQLGVSGFRMDGAPFVIEEVHPDTADRTMHYEWLNDLRDHIAWRRGDAVVLAEANVPREQILEFFGPRGDRLPMMFNFAENQQIFLALARETAVPVQTAIQSSPAIPPSTSWATFLRNHDEIDLSGLRESERADVFAKFGPEKEMQLYGRGIRRRLATMLGGDQRRIRLAYVLQFSLPGTPVVRYGEEIGMGEDLSLQQRDAIRTPMQWADSPQAGFSTNAETVRPVISKGDFGYPEVNVRDQTADPASLLSWFQRLLPVLRDCPEFGIGTCTVLDTKDDRVLGLRYECPTGAVLAVLNLSTAKVTVDLKPQPGIEDGFPVDVFADRAYPDPGDLSELQLDGSGYRWLRLARTVGA
ncbi:MAG TPA: alpha-amylase family protein [Mycobacteriales bacterium]|jgi:maltose alpha-D-glucosyltransferase/alpha-amylase|nr:alpha-amylase family protein [Mycobacteriales bacterium]